MLSCNTCKEQKPKDAFNLRSNRVRGYEYECRDCRNAEKRECYRKEPAPIMAKRRQREREWKARHPERAAVASQVYHATEKGIQTRARSYTSYKAKGGRRAVSAVRNALASGKMVRPQECSACPAVGSIEAHHHKGYAPEHRLSVVWLCTRCHRRADRGILQTA